MSTALLPPDFCKFYPIPFHMKISFTLLAALATATLTPTMAATPVSNYEQAQAQVNEDGYILFIYGADWDKRAEENIRALFNSPAIAKAAGKAVMMQVPLTEATDDAAKAKLQTIMGKLALPHAHSKYSYPAVVMYDQSGRQYSIICGPPMLYPEAKRIAGMIEQRRRALAQQNELLSLAEKANAEERPQLILRACRIKGIEWPNRAKELLKQADPEDKSGCLAALNFYNNPVGDKINEMPITEALAEMDKAISNPLHTVQQKQNACAFAIGLIRRRIGTGAAEAIRHYAEIMRDLDPESVLGRSAVIVMRDWTTGLQYSRGWSRDSLPIPGVSTELYGHLPLAEAGTYEVRFTPTGGKHHAIVSRVELLDGESSIAVDDRTITLTSPASYFLTAPAELKKPRIRITFDNGEKERDTRGNITITRK